MNRRPSVIRLLAALAFFAGLCTPTSELRAQNPPTPEEGFAQLRSRFYGDVLNRSKLLSEQYRNALQRLEVGAAQAGRYDLALRLRDRQTELTQIFSSTDSSLAQTLATPLLDEGARMTGVTSPDKGVFSGWRASSSYVEWRNVPINPGDYHLELDYLMLDAPVVSTAPGVAAERTAMFDFFEVSLLAGASDNRRSFELTASRDSTSYTSLKIGPITYSRGPLTLRLTPVKGYPGNVIWIRNLRLTPHQTEASESTPSTPERDFSQSLADLRGHFRAQLEQARQKAAETHLDFLQQLRAGNANWKQPIEAEIKQAEKIRRSKLTDKEPLLPRPLASLGGIAGFEDIEDATFINRPDNTGDRFWVATGDAERQIKLLWIDCAPKDDGPSSRFSEHFGIDPNDAALFGRAAAEFTAGYLEGKRLRLLVRNQPGPDGTLSALVFLPDLGLYQNHLVDQGLAAVSATKHPSRSTLEKALLNSLLQRERESQYRDPRPGAWALSSRPLEP